MIALRRGDHERAAALFEEDLPLLRELGDKVNLVYCLLGSAGVAAALQEAIGSVADSPFVRSLYDHESLLAAARSRLDEEKAWKAAWWEGRERTSEEVIESALSEGEQGPQTAAPALEEPPFYPAGLSTREAEVLKLVARGLTNAQVAKVLFISHRTVERHLNSVYTKLGVKSRAAATRFAREHELA